VLWGLLRIELEVLLPEQVLLLEDLRNLLQVEQDLDQLLSDLVL
jgi:hypothetical protein